MTDTFSALKTAERFDINLMEVYTLHVIKTQIQLPDELYHRAKAFAKTREWSLAETFRRAAEDMFETYPHHPDSLKEWSFPEPRNLGWKTMDAREMHRVAMDDMEPQLP